MKKAKQKNQNKGFVLRSFMKLAFFAFVVYALVSIISIQVTISEKNDQLSVLQAKADELKDENAESDRLLNVTDEKEYMEKIAMEKLGYSYPNETRYYDISRN